MACKLATNRNNYYIKLYALRLSPKPQHGIDTQGEDIYAHSTHCGLPGLPLLANGS